MGKRTSLWILEKAMQFDTRLDVYVDLLGPQHAGRENHRDKDKHPVSFHCSTPFGGVNDMVTSTLSCPAIRTSGG